MVRTRSESRHREESDTSTASSLTRRSGRSNRRVEGGGGGDAAASQTQKAPSAAAEPAAASLTRSTRSRKDASRKPAEKTGEGRTRRSGRIAENEKSDRNGTGEAAPADHRRVGGKGTKKKPVVVLRRLRNRDLGRNDAVAPTSRPNDDVVIEAEPQENEREQGQRSDADVDIEEGVQEEEQQQQQQQQPRRVEQREADLELPKRSSLPDPNIHMTSEEVKQKLKEVQAEVRVILGKVLQRVQAGDEEEEENGYAEREVFWDGYRVVERVYEYYGEVYKGDFAGDDIPPEIRARVRNQERSYRNAIVYVLWGFGGVVWRRGGGGGKPSMYLERVAKFIDFCLERLGWGVAEEGDEERQNDDMEVDGEEERARRRRERRRRRRRERRQQDVGMEAWSVPGMFPACYYVVNLFDKYHSDISPSVRLHELSLIHRLVERAGVHSNFDFLRHVFRFAKKALFIRLKDRAASCRGMALRICAGLLVKKRMGSGEIVDLIEGAEEELLKELKYLTRYDPVAEVRRIGTQALSGVERLKLRFFFDQAFDRNVGVRLEAFKALCTVIPVENNEQNGQDDGAEVEESEWNKVAMIRDMGTLNSEWLNKLVIWGTTYSDSKCSAVVRKELLPKWLHLSCHNDLVAFIQNLDPFEHPNAVGKIIDMMLGGSEEEFRRNVDGNEKLAGFVAPLRAAIRSRNYKEVSIEAMVGWLGLVKASQRGIGGGEDQDSAGNLQRRVVPGSAEMCEVVEGLHEAVYFEHAEAGRTGRVEEAGPIYCLVIGLEVCRYVDWEEGGRRHLRSLIKTILLDPILDEKIILVEAISVLAEFYRDANEMDEFDDLMMEIFQDVFDSKSEYNILRRRRCAGSGAVSPVDAPSPDQQEAVSGGVGEEEAMEVSEGEGDPGPPAEAAEEVQEEAPPMQEEAPMKQLLNPYQLTKLKEKLCDLATSRFQLMSEKDVLLREKRFAEAIPINQRILALQDEEAQLKAELEEQATLGLLQKQQQQANAAHSGSATSPSLPGLRKSLGLDAGPGVEAAPGSDVGVGPAAVQEEEEEEEELVFNEDGVLDEEERVRRREERMRRRSRGVPVVAPDGEVVMMVQGVVSSVEEGLSKGMYMVNAYMGLGVGRGVVGLNPFVRNVYENYLGLFVRDRDVNLQCSILQFITYVALAEKSELQAVSSILVRYLYGVDVVVRGGGRSSFGGIGSSNEVGGIQCLSQETVCTAYKCLVDLLIANEFKDFCYPREEERDGDWRDSGKLGADYVEAYTLLLRRFFEEEDEGDEEEVDARNITYLTCGEEEMRHFLLKTITGGFHSGEGGGGRRRRRNNNNGGDGLSMASSMLSSQQYSQSQQQQQQGANASMMVMMMNGTGALGEAVNTKMRSQLISIQNQGLLKLLVRGRLRDPKVVARVLGLWVNNEYSGTGVLRDLESVVRLYGTFEWWWGKGDGSGSVVEEVEGEDLGGIDDEERDDGSGNTRRKPASEAMRVLGVAVGEAVVMLSQELGKGSVGVEEFSENVLKFVGYFLGFLDRDDQPLMRTIACTILSPIERYPSRSYNTILVRCAARIPITSMKSAELVRGLIRRIQLALRPFPQTTSLTQTKRELVKLLKKLERVFGIGREEDEEGGEEEAEEEERRIREGDDDDDETEERRHGGVGGVVRFSSSSSSEEDEE